MKRPIGTELEKIYTRLFDRFGPQHWWPGRTRFEVMAGAILTQNTNWRNVAKAIANLRKERLLSPGRIRAVPFKKLARLIRPSGYYNIKARRLKNFVEFLHREYQGRLDRMARQPLALLRAKVLSVNGIGPETADSILLYAFGKPVFVVDAYTVRICRRHLLIDGPVDYHTLQEMFADHLGRDARLFNEYHALLVRLGKEFCRPRALCPDCPLEDLPHVSGRPSGGGLPGGIKRHEQPLQREKPYI